MQWTKEQKNVIEFRNRNILVSAAAGSGKTAVLSERVLQKLNKGIKINELLILTFTNAAAGEMKERIRKKITDNPKIHDNLDLIDSSYITTFDFRQNTRRMRRVFCT
jgi:ATP-dependent helicase/nuclease subunit A